MGTGKLEVRKRGKPAKLVTFRLSPDDHAWFIHAARDRKLTVSAYFRQVLEGDRTRYGLPLPLWRVLEAFMREQDLTEQQFISELLRREAERLDRRTSRTGA